MATHRTLSAQSQSKEDLLLFLNAARAGTGQDEFYEGAQAQAYGVEFLHQYMAINYRDLYLLVLAKAANYYSQSLAVYQLLKNPPPPNYPQHKQELGQLLELLRRMPASKAYRALIRLVDGGVNNRRSRALIRDYLFGQKHLEFHAVKYRRKIRRLVRHAHLKVEGELARVLFQRAHEKKVFKTPLFEIWRAAHYSQKALFQLPATVAEGIAARQGISRKVFLKGIASQLTRQERLRSQNTYQRAGQRLEVDWSRASLLQIILAGFALGEKEYQRRAEFEQALDEAVQRLALRLKRAFIQRPQTALILDRSYSMSGSSAKKQRALAYGVALEKLYEALPLHSRSFGTYSAPTSSWLELRAQGPSDLARPLLEALKWGAQEVVICSDGYENTPAGGVHAIVSAYERNFAAQRPVTWLQLNPVFSAQELSPRALSPLVPTVGVREAEELHLGLAIGRFAQGKVSLRGLKRLLES